MPKLAIFCCLVLFSCSQSVEDKFRNSAIPTERWAYQMNTDRDSLGQLYEPDAYLAFQGDGWQLVQGQAGIAAYYSGKNIGPIDSVWSAGKVKASETIDYEIINLQGPSKAYVQLVVWKKDSFAVRRQLEVLAEEGAMQSEWRAEIDTARNKWMKFCNSHDPAKLVSEVYTTEAMYYNHKPMVVGTTAITREYGYMANAEYTLALAPLVVEPVSSTLVFEIGQCLGSYGGKYMLVWVKAGDGRWQVQLDSNIWLLVGIVYIKQSKGECTSWIAPHSEQALTRNWQRPTRRIGRKKRWKSACRLQRTSIVWHGTTHWTIHREWTERYLVCENRDEMGNIFNTDFQDFLSCLNACKVEYILVGGYSVILHGYPRTTGDLDVWVGKTEENYRRLAMAFTQFGLSLFDMTKENFLFNPQFDVFSFGRQPVGIDILTQVKGLEFSEANKNAFYKNVEGLNVRVIHLDDLRKAKIAANRPKDIDDLEKLGRGE